MALSRERKSFFMLTPEEIAREMGRIIVHPDETRFEGNYQKTKEITDEEYVEHFSMGVLAGLIEKRILAGLSPETLLDLAAEAISEATSEAAASS